VVILQTNVFYAKVNLHPYFDLQIKGWRFLTEMAHFKRDENPFIGKRKTS
jgi:hypothetical protein